jgi:hypothetical protein
VDRRGKVEEVRDGGQVREGGGGEEAGLADLRSAGGQSWHKGFQRARHAREAGARGQGPTLAHGARGYLCVPTLRYTVLKPL